MLLTKINALNADSELLTSGMQVARINYSIHCIFEIFVNWQRHVLILSKPSRIRAILLTELPSIHMTRASYMWNHVFRMCIMFNLSSTRSHGVGLG